MKRSFIYTLKVWLTSVVLAPPVIVILTKLFLPHEMVFDNVANVLSSIVLLIYLATIVSIPSWMLLWLSTALIIKFNFSNTYNKVILTVIGCILCVLPFYLLFHEDDNPSRADLAIWASSYMLVIVGGIWFYKLKIVSTSLFRSMVGGRF